MLKEVEGKEKYHTDIPNRFVALKDLSTAVEINSYWEMITEIQNFS
jgi:hypothetical protein